MDGLDYGVSSGIDHIAPAGTPQGPVVPPVHRTLATAARIATSCGSGPVSVADVLASGVTEGQLRAAVRSGAVVRVRHGVVALPEQPPRVDDMSDAGVDQRRAQHRRDLEAAIAALGPEAVVSHGSAALLHGLPSLRPGRFPGRPVVTVPSHGRIRTGIHARLGTVPEPDRDDIDGLPCTSDARTALDMARFRPLHESLVVMDPAVARCGAESMWSAYARRSGTYGMRALREAISLADPRAESPLESASRGYLHEAGLPRADLQAWVRVADGRRYRVDFLWRERRVIGEADGWAKYADITDLREEKRREDALRAAGFTVVRWTSDELWRTPDIPLARLRTALTR